MCYCIACLPSMPQVSPHAGHSRHSRPSVGVHHGNADCTLFTPLYEAEKHGNRRERMCVCVCVLEEEGGGGGEIETVRHRGKDQCESGGTHIFIPRRHKHPHKDACTDTHTHTHTHRLNNPDYRPSVESSGTVVPLWPRFLPVGSLWASQWRPLESPLLWQHQILFKPTNDWDYTAASSASARSTSDIQPRPHPETKARSSGGESPALKVGTTFPLKDSDNMSNTFEVEAIYPSKNINIWSQARVIWVL